MNTWINAIQILKNDYDKFKQYDNNPNNLTLRHIGIGEIFIYRGVDYQKIEDKRVNSLCLNLNNDKRYLISMIAPVIKK